MRQNYESIAAYLWFLLRVRETGWFGGFAIFSRTRVGRRGRAILEEKPPNSPRPGCHPYGVTNSEQEPILCQLCRNSLPPCPHDRGEFPRSTKNSSFIVCHNTLPKVQIATYALPKNLSHFFCAQSSGLFPFPPCSWSL